MVYRCIGRGLPDCGITHTSANIAIEHAKELNRRTDSYGQHYGFYWPSESENGYYWKA